MLLTPNILQPEIWFGLVIWFGLLIWFGFLHQYPHYNTQCSNHCLDKKNEIGTEPEKKDFNN